MGRPVTELWTGIVPVVAANNYLRSDPSWTPNTVTRKAYALFLFFDYLQRNGVLFWDPRVRHGGEFVTEFRNQLTRRCRAQDGSKITWSYAKYVMWEVYCVCAYWRQPADPELIERRVLTSSRGAFSHKNIVSEIVAAPFQVTIPASERRGERHVLLPNEVVAIWTHLTSLEPRAPAILRDSPAGPGRGASAARVRSWQAAQERFAVRLAWHRRQVMLWALLISTGCRRSEAPLLMSQDVALYHEDLWATLRVRHEHSHLGAAKTGPRSIYMGFDRQAYSAWEAWRVSRPVLVRRWSARTGKPDHGMFLVNRDGSPLTVRSIRSLLDGLNRHFGGFGDEGFGCSFRLHTHACRHTIASLFDDWGVPKDVKRRHLGHASAQTSDLYGKVYRTTYVNVLRQFEQHLLAGASQSAPPVGDGREGTKG